MKALFSTLVLLMIGPLLLEAKGPGGGGSGGGGPGSGSGPGGRLAAGPRVQSSQPGQTMQALERFLAMSDEELLAIETTIQRIRQMTPAERQQYRERIARFEALPSEEKASLQQSWGQLDARIRGAWRQFMAGKTPEERAAMQEALQAVPPEERTRWRLRQLEQAGSIPAGEP